MWLYVIRNNPKTGEWAHTSRMTKFPNRKWLSHFDIMTDSLKSGGSGAAKRVNVTEVCAAALRDAQALVDALQKRLVKAGKALDEARAVAPSASELTNSAQSHDNVKWFLTVEDLPKHILLPLIFGESHIIVIHVFVSIIIAIIIIVIIIIIIITVMHE